MCLGAVHTVRNTAVALVCSASGVGLVAAPTALLVNAASASLLSGDFGAAHDWAVKLDPAKWPDGFVHSIDDSRYACMLLALTEAVYLACGAFYVLFVSFLARRPRLEASTLLPIAGLLLMFVLRAGLALGYASKELDVSPAFVRAYQQAVAVLVVAPTMGTALIRPLPRELRTARLYLQVSFVLLVVLAAYISWRQMCEFYFRLECEVVRVLAGALIPQILQCITFEALLWYNMRLQRQGCTTAARVFLAAAAIFGVTMSATLQFGSTNLLSATLLELITALVELKAKHSLLSGNSPIDVLVYTFGRCKRWLPRLGATKVSDFSGVLPGEACASDDPEREGRKALLVSCVVQANLSELTAHMIVGSLFLFVHVNPNASLSSPIPSARIAALLSMRLVIELLTDFAVAVLASRMSPARWAAAVDECTADFTKQVGYVSVGVFSVLWAVNNICQYFINLCPAPTPTSLSAGRQIELLSLALCPRP